MDGHDWEDTGSWMLTPRPPRAVTFSFWYRRLRTCRRCGARELAGPELCDDDVASAMQGAPFSLQFGEPVLMDPPMSCDLMSAQEVMDT